MRGKVVALTGGSRGLGLVLARDLIRRGARVAICSRAIPTLERAANELRAIAGSSHDVLAVPADMTRPYDIELFFEAVHEAFGPVDVLINNAAMIQVGPAQDMTIDDYRSSRSTRSSWSSLRMTEAVAAGDARARQTARS